MGILCVGREIGHHRERGIRLRDKLWNDSDENPDLVQDPGHNLDLEVDLDQDLDHSQDQDQGGQDRDQDREVDLSQILDQGQDRLLDQE